MRDVCGGSGLTETPTILPGPYSRSGPGGRKTGMIESLDQTVEPEAR